MSLNIHFITPALLKERVAISSKIDDAQLKPIIKVAQDLNIMPTLGSNLYKRMQEGVRDNNLNSYEQTLLKDYLTDALVWHTVSMMPTMMGFQFFSKGMLIKTSEESDPPSKGTMELIERKYKSIAEYYTERMIKYLKTYYQLYPQYLSGEINHETIQPDVVAYKPPFFLGIPSKKRRDYGNAVSPTVPPTPPITAPFLLTYTATGGEVSFTLAGLATRTILTLTRATLVVQPTTDVNNTDTNKLYISGDNVVLPVGDIATAGEVFTALVV